MKRYIKFLDSECYVCMPAERSRFKNSNLGMQKVSSAPAPTLAGGVTLDRFLDLSQARVITSTPGGLTALQATTL